MTKQKVTLSLDHDLYSQFQTIKEENGYSISAWVDAKMATEILKQQKQQTEKVCQLLRNEYSLLIEDMTDEQMMNEIVTIFMARKFWKDNKNSAYHNLHTAIESI